MGISGVIGGVVGSEVMGSKVKDHGGVMGSIQGSWGQGSSGSKGKVTE